MKPDPKQLFGHRLSQARRMAGLSLRALADKLGGRLSYNALHKYEQGQMMPDSEALIAVADALDRNVDFFFRPLEVELKEVRFRKLSKLGVKGEDAIRQRAIDYFERYQEIEQILGLPQAFTNPLEGFRLGKAADVEAAAERVREVWKLGLDPLPSVIEVLESRGIKVFDVDAPKDFDGFAGWADGAPVIVLAQWLNDDLPRKRFTALHETAHLLMPLPAELADKEHERYCHRFAGAMLMPEEVFREEWGGHRQRLTLEELKDLKARYGISIAALVRRAFDLELIDQALYQRFFVIQKQQGWHRAEPGQYLGRESSRRFEQLVLRAGAEENISQTKGAALLNKPLEDYRRLLQEAA